MKKNLLSIAIAALVIFALGSCKKKDNTPANNARIMFVNACAGTTNVDVKVNSAAVGAASNMAFLKNSGYQNLTAGGSSTLEFFLTNLGTPLTSGSQSLTVNTSYSAFAGGLITGSSFVFTTDDLTAPTSGNAKIRFINLCSDALNETCYIGSIKIDSNVSYKTCTPYHQIAATASGTTVLFQDPLQAPYLAQLSGQQFSAGKIYTIMLTGAKTGTGASALTLTVINNN
jgi:hypothetical protein